MHRTITAAALLALTASTASAELILLMNAQSQLAIVNSPNYTASIASSSARERSNDCSMRFIGLATPAYRSTDGFLYAYGAFGSPANTSLYRVNAYNGFGTPVAVVGAAYSTVTVPEFTPDGSELRVIRYNAAQTIAENLRINSDTGALIAAETNLSYSNVAGVIPRLGSMSFNNDSPPRLLAIDIARRSLVEIGSAAGGAASWNSGVCTELVAINFPPNQTIGGFDISPVDGTAYIQYSQNNSGTSHVRNLATLNLTNGQLTVIAQPGSPGAHVGPTIVFDDNVAPPPVCPADANKDLAINSCDLSIVLGNFGSAVPPPTSTTNYGDANNDGLVNSADLSVLLANFGGSC